MPAQQVSPQIVISKSKSALARLVFIVLGTRTDRTLGVPSPQPNPACRSLVNLTFAGSGQSPQPAGEDWGWGRCCGARPHTTAPGRRFAIADASPLLAQGRRPKAAYALPTRGRA